MTESPARKLAEWREHPAQMVRELFHVQPDAWQEEALETFPTTRRMCMKACAGPGKAQPKTTPIPTPDGLRIFGHLRVGDRVFTADGSITTVRAIYDRGVLPIYRIAFDDGSATHACGEHLWKVRGRTERRHFNARASKDWSAKKERQARAQGWPLTPDDGYVVISTEQIIERSRADGARRQFEIPRQGPVQFLARALPLDPYVLGVWLGDGVRLSGKYATKPTHEIQHEIERRGYETGSPEAGIVTVYGITGALRELELFPCYSHQRFVPDDYLQSSIRDRTDLLCGLMDTDGGVDDDGHMQFATTSDDLVDDVMWLARSLGGTAHRAKIKKPFYYGKNREKIAGRDCHRIVLRLPFNPFRVPQRKARWKDPAKTPASLRYMTRFIDKITAAGEADCMCIEVDHPSALYLTNDFIVTHNTAVLAWLGWNFMLTRPFPIVGCTSVSGDNLKANLWTELARWRGKAPLLMRLFEQTKTEIFSREHPQTWRMEARTWAKDADAQQIGNALAGLHAKYIMWLLDESGDYPNAIMPVCEGIFNGEPEEAHIVQAGNPTRLDGPLYRACTTARKLWRVIEITADPDDPKRTPRVSVETAREQIEQYGRENPWVLVRIFGQFPAASFNALIGPDEVSAAMKRYYRPMEIGKASKILGVDVARFGDDGSVIARREGIQMYPLEKRRNIDSTQGAGWVNEVWNKFEADAAFIDGTGGHGAGWGDQLRNLGRSPILVQFAGEPHQKVRYFNKRTEMAFDLVQWIKDGGALPDNPELLAALTKTTYTFKGDKLLLAPKDVIKAELGYSPDEMDAAMLTFAEPVVAAKRQRPTQMATKYDPFRELDSVVRESYDTSRNYDPFR